MKNLFDYATKELSQDAFLRWLFESYEDEQIRPIVADFITNFTFGQEDGRPQLVVKPDDIKNIKTFAQVNDIDVCIDIWLPTGKPATLSTFIKARKETL